MSMEVQLRYLGNDDGPTSGHYTDYNPEVGIYKRKQESKKQENKKKKKENKNSTKKVIKKKKKVFWSSSCFLTFFYINSHLRAILDDKSHISDKSAIGAPAS